MHLVGYILEYISDARIPASSR